MTALLDHAPQQGQETTETPRWRIRPRRSRVVAVALLAVSVAVASAWLLSWWSPVPVREVVVRGAVPDTEAEIESVAGIEIGTPLREIDADAIAARVDELQGIDGVALVLQRPWTVVIDVQERFPFAVVAAGERWTILDQDGQLIREVDSKPSGIPEVLGPSEEWAGTFAAVAALPAGVQARTATAAATEQGTVELTMKSGTAVDWGRPERNEDKARVLVALLPLKASRITVAAPERPAVSGDAQVPKRNQPESAADPLP